MTSPLWRRVLYGMILRVYFARITVLNRSRLPQTGPVLFLGLHRNGAVDGFVYHEALGAPTFMISTQLRKNWFARLFFAGIAVTRTKDEGDRGANDQALQECVRHLQQGGALFVFPEGTSSLGPRHLPFKSGALWLILDYLKSGGPPLQVIPVGIHYECPWAFRAKVEVVVGEPLDLSPITAFNPAELPSPNAAQLSRLKALKRIAQTGLESVGVNVIDSEYQSRIQQLAYASTLATPRSYFRSLKALEKQIPEPILREGDGLESESRGRRLLFHQGVPLVPMGSILLYLAALCVLAPVVLASILFNAPPFAAGFLAGKTFPDDVNVISLWRILVGIPMLLIWMIVVSGVCLALGKPQWVLAYAVVTWAGLHLYYRVKKLIVAVHNGLRYPRLRPAMLRFRETLIQSLPAEPAADNRL